MERKFAHINVNWTIENSHILPMNLTFQILSPEFEVRVKPLVTNWIMKLKNKEIDGEYKLHFQLDNLDSGEENLHFFGQCNVEISSKSRNEIVFRDYFTWEVNSNEKSLSRHIHPNHSYDILLLYNLHIQCKLLIKFVGVEEDIEVCRDIGLRELSRDLLKLYESRRHTDVTLKVTDTDSDHHIYAHKLVLHSRNTILRNILYSDTKYVTVDYSGRFEEWKNIVKFLYTADMKHVLNPPRISYYDISVLYNIEPIISFFQPDELNLYSVIPLEEFAIMYTFPNFLTSNEICIETPRLINGTKDTDFEISVYPRSFSNESEACIIIKVRGQIPKSILIQLYASNAHREELLKRICGNIVNSRTYEERSFHEREILNYYVQHGKLTLTLNLQMVNLSLLETHKRYSGTKISHKPFSVENNFRTLSRDIMKFYYDCNIPKTKIIINNEEYLIHKCIFFVRAQFLFDKIHKCKIVKHGQARRWIVIQLIYFLYTGKYNSPFNLKDVLALYEIADSFNVENLKLILKQEIELNVHAFCTQDLLKVFLIIDSQNMPNLRRYARNVLDSSTINKLLNGNARELSIC